MKQKELEKQEKEEAERQRQAAEEAKRKEAMELLSMSMGCKVRYNHGFVDRAINTPHP